MNPSARSDVTVFISSTVNDLKSYRDAARDAVLKVGFRPVMMEYFASSGAMPPIRECLRKVDQANVVVVLVAHQYGWVPKRQSEGEYKSIIWLECERAVKARKEVLAFLVDDSYAWPENLKEESQVVAALRNSHLDIELLSRLKRNIDGLTAFRHWLNQRGIRACFTTPEDLQAKVIHALDEWKSRGQAESRRRPSAKAAGDAELEALTLRTAFREPMTRLMCAYYGSESSQSGLVVAPDGMPVLSTSAFLPAAPSHLEDIDQHIELDRVTAPFAAPGRGRAMVSIIQERLGNSGLFNGLIFRLLDVGPEGKFHFCLGNYFDFLNSCDVLTYELALAIAKNQDLRQLMEQGSFDEGQALRMLSAKGLPYRAGCKPLDFRSRSTAFGTCALVVIKGTNHPAQMVLNTRSSTLVETAGLTHVIPAGSFQPTMQDDRFLRNECSFTENLVREFCEELFDDQGISGRETRREVFGSLDDLYGPVGQAFRRTIITPKRYKLIYLGTVIDPVNLKPEALTVLMLHAGYLLSVCKEWKTSWETKAGTIHLWEFNKEKIDLFLSDRNLVPTGRAHFMLVRKHLDFLLSELAGV